MKRIRKYRRHERVSVSLDVFFSNPGELIGKTSNFSIDGMFIETEEPLETGTRLSLSFKLPNQVTYVKVYCDVRWVKSDLDSAESNPPGMGVKFIDISKEHRRRIEEYLKKCLRLVKTAEPYLKRPLDLLLSAFGLAVLAPLWLIIALAIRLEDGGPVFYTQERWGKDKNKIKAYKFRTMVKDADKKWKFMDIGNNGHDPRITRVGRILRNTALDEMPQLLNICKGEMSFVGPRALPINVRVNEHDANLPDEEIPGFDLRSKVRPGLTGVMQLYASSKYISRKKKFRYDIVYIQNQSFWFDIKLILTSVVITLKGGWEDNNKV